MAQKVTIEMSAADANLVAAWQKLKSLGPDAYEQSLRKVKVESESLRGQFDTMIGGAIAKWVSLEFAVTKVSEGIKKVIQMELEYRRVRNEAAATQEEATAKFINQTITSGLSVSQRSQLAGRSAQIGSRFGVRPAESIGLATELASQGVQAQQVPGFLGESLKFATAQGKPLDMEMVKAITQQVRVQDQSMSAATLAQVAREFFGIFLTRPLQPDQITDFARYNSTLKAAGMSNAEQLAFNTASLEILGESRQAATVDRAFVSKLRAPTSEGTKALGQLGLKPTDVDFIGENLGTILERLAAGLANVNEELRVPALTDIFGQEYGGTAATLIERRKNYEAIVREAQGGAANFEGAVGRNLETGAAIGRSAKAQGMVADAGQGSSASAAGRDVLQTILKGGKSSATRQWFADMQYQFAEAIDPSQTREQAASRVSLIAKRHKLDGGDGALMKDEAIDVQAETLMLLKEIRDNTADKGVVIESDGKADQERRGSHHKAPLQALGRC